MIPSLIKSRKINFGLVGCGRISNNHLKAIASFSEDINLAGLCDIDSSALDKACAEYGAPGFDDYQTMLQDPNIDIVSICTPSGLHPEQAIMAAKAGKHVLSEKPMATDLQSAIEMVEVCENLNRHLFIVKQNRRNATMQLLKKAIDENRFGKIYMVSTNVFWTRPQDYYDQAPWRGTWALDGGAFMNQASHYVDLMYWLFGEVDTVQAITGTLARKIEAEDSGVVNLRYKNGILASMAVTMLTYPKNLEGSITIIGEKGTVRIGGVAVNEIEHWEFADQREEDAHIKEASYQTTSVYGFGHPLYYKNVIDVLRGQAEPQTGGRDGLQSFELLIAIYQAAKENKSIALPLIK